MSSETNIVGCARNRNWRLASAPSTQDRFSSLPVPSASVCSTLLVLQSEFFKEMLSSRAPHISYFWLLQTSICLLAPSGALIAIPTYYWPTTNHFFRSHRSSTLDFHFLSHYSYIKAIMLYKGKTWQDSGILWNTLSYSDILWHTLARSGILWHTLSYSGMLMHTLTYSGILWHTLTYSGIL